MLICWPIFSSGPRGKTKLEKFPQILFSKIVGIDVLPPGSLSLTTTTEPNALFSLALSESSALVLI